LRRSDGELGGTARRSLLRCGVLVLLAVGASVAVLPRAAQSAATGACGSVLLPGANWLGGAGVDVKSNGSDQGTPKECSKSLSTVGGVTSGEKWQCVELVNRLYLTRGWIHSAWNGDGDQMYANAPGNLAKQPNGSITSVSPGDVVSVRETHNGSSRKHGHTAIINTTGTVTSGTVPLVSQNGGSKAYPLVTTNAYLQNGTLTIPGGSGWKYTIIGVVDAPDGATT
jgi:CHAP domain